MADDIAASIRHVNPPKLGKPPGYSQIVEVRAGRLVFIAGQTALDENGELVGNLDCQRLLVIPSPGVLPAPTHTMKPSEFLWNGAPGVPHAAATCEGS